MLEGIHGAHVLAGTGACFIAVSHNMHPLRCGKCFYFRQCFVAKLVKHSTNEGIAGTGGVYWLYGYAGYNSGGVINAEHGTFPA